MINTRLPEFKHLNPQQSLTQLETVLASAEQELGKILSNPHPSWENLVEPLDAMSDRIRDVWGPIAHLFGVWSTPEWREAYNQGLPKVTEFWVGLSQNTALCNAYQAIQASPLWQQYSPTRQKVVTDALKEFALSGVALPSAEKQRFKELSLKQSELQSQFEAHVMDCVQAYSFLVTQESELAGMSQTAIAGAKAKAQAKQQDGWLITLDFPSFDAVISHCSNRDLRKTLYTAYCTRAASNGPHSAEFDNGPLMMEILRIRHQQAQLLGFKNYAEVSLATKMADSITTVEQFLLDLAVRARPRAEAELAELQALAAEDGIVDLQPWDTAFYSERLRERTLGVSDELLRPYFPMPQVLNGLFTIIKRLFGVQIEPRPEIATWHPDASAYALTDAHGTELGYFYLDPYSRPETKRGGAWMDECVGRRLPASGPLQLPVAYLVGNFRPPQERDPALLTHDEVLTLFHEFGHGLHHLLTQVNEGSVSGIRGVEWDAVELPSQFMENWCYHPQSLQGFAQHYQTGEVMPESLIKQLQADRQFQSGLATLRQIEFSLFDLRLHRDYASPNTTDILDCIAAVRREVSITPPPDFNRMPWSFTHIFSGGYAAGYYSYKWAEVLSSDAFAAFEESQFAPATGERFKSEILARGGSRSAMENFKSFRDREPQIDALLRHCGLIAVSGT